MNDELEWQNFIKNIKPLKIKKRSNSYIKEITKKAFFHKNESFPFELSENRKIIEKNNYNNLNKLTIKNFKKFRHDYSILDLHGKNIEDSVELFERFIKKNFLNNNRYLLVITGKGEIIDENYNGKIKNEINNWLNFSAINQLILTYSDAPKYLGGEGALIILLKKFIKS